MEQTNTNQKKDEINLEKAIEFAYAPSIEWSHSTEGPYNGIYTGIFDHKIKIELGRYEGSPQKGSNKTEADFFYFKIKGTMPAKSCSLCEINGEPAMKAYEHVADKYRGIQKSLKEKNLEYLKYLLKGDE